MARSLPDPTHPDFSHYWQGCHAGELRVQWCPSCAVRQWPPRPGCRRCGRGELDWVAVGPRGRVHSFVVVHRPTIAGFDDHVPYAVLLVESASDPAVRFLGNLEGLRAGPVAVGSEVEVVFEEVAPDLVMPYWRVA